MPGWGEGVRLKEGGEGGRGVSMRVYRSRSSARTATAVETHTLHVYDPVVPNSQGAALLPTNTHAQKQAGALNASARLFSPVLR